MDFSAYEKALEDFPRYLTFVWRRHFTKSSFESS